VVELELSNLQALAAQIQVGEEATFLGEEGLQGSFQKWAWVGLGDQKEAKEGVE
jgi:hypothetical protein